MNPVILIIDDSFMVRQQLRRALVACSFDVIEAVDGIDALEKAKSIGGALALVICDVNMPRMNGLDFLEAFRKEEQFRSTPTLILTTEAKPDLVQHGKALDVKGWIIKPFKPQLLAAAVKKLTLPNAA